MMRKILAIFSIVCSVMLFGQANNNNPFNGKNSENTFNDNKVAAAPGDTPGPNEHANPKATDNPGQPGDPVPIDNYLPILLLMAMGIIIYQKRLPNPSQS